MSGNIVTTIKKHAKPNIPYLFMLWAFLKLGTAFQVWRSKDAV